MPARSGGGDVKAPESKTIPSCNALEDGLRSMFLFPGRMQAVTDQRAEALAEELEPAGALESFMVDEMARAIVQRVKSVVLLKGTATPKLEKQLQIADEQLRMSASESSEPFSIPNSQFSILGPFGDFEAAINSARALAEPGDVVLLSPGCASFGMFQNEFHRGDEFRRIVNQL